MPMESAKAAPAMVGDDLDSRETAVTNSVLA
jgi:hypothetical protein